MCAPTQSDVLSKNVLCHKHTCLAVRSDFVFLTHFLKNITNKIMLKISMVKISGDTMILGSFFSPNILWKKSNRFFASPVKLGRRRVLSFENQTADIYIL